MRSRSSSSPLTHELSTVRDHELTLFVGSLLDAARHTWGDRIIAEGDGTFDPRQLYTETHYALTAVLMFACTGRNDDMLDLAESRLRLWAARPHPLTFFNAMAICLATIVFRRSGASHPSLSAVLDDLIGRTRTHRHVAYPQWCGNNAYLQQVAVDTVLLPVARGVTATRAGLDLLIREFRAFRTREGFFFDLPRSGNAQERLCPPTYIMKMLFLLGVCHELTASPECAELFASGMRATLPLLTRQGNFSYFGRTDNSPFATGLTIFNLRKLAQLPGGDSHDCIEAATQAERFYLSFPRTPYGLLKTNRFDGKSSEHEALSKDAYAYVAQYSLSSSAYALMAAHWFPSRRLPAPEGARSASIAKSDDLGIVRLSSACQELVIRTRTEMTGWDRRYLGPTILRYQRDEQLMVGAISRTVSTEAPLQKRPADGRLSRILDLFRYRYRQGSEHLDAVSVGFVPVLRKGPVDFVPYTPIEIDVSAARVKSRFNMVGVRVRGIHPCFVEAVNIAHANVPGLKPKRFMRPSMRSAAGLQLLRELAVTSTSCRLEDEITGPLDGRELLFSVRRLPGACVRVEGLKKRHSFVGWGSDGTHTVDVFGATAAGSKIAYSCEIGMA